METIKNVWFENERIYMLSSEDKVICETFLSLKNGDKAEFDSMSEALFSWAKIHVK